jgi:GT2 family glycosyltransferase
VLPKVFIVILNYKAWRDTIACLESNYRGSYPHFETVVVDNASDDDSLREIRTWAETHGVPIKGETDLRGQRPIVFTVSRFEARALTLIETGGNLGFSAGNNRGIEHAMANGADLVFLLNNDTVVEEDTLKRLVAAIESDEQIGAVFPLVCGVRGEIQVPVYLRAPANFWELLLASNVLGIVWRRYRFLAYLERRNPFPDYRYDRFITVPNLVVACTVYRRSFFEGVGLFDENLFMYYEEDVMLHKLKRTRLRVGFEPRARIVHKGGIGNSRLPPPFLYLRRACGELHYVRTYMGVGSVKQRTLKLLRLMEYLYRMKQCADYRARFPEFLRQYWMG